jgi:hypothetical protein
MSFLAKGERKKMAFWASLSQLSMVSRKRIGAKARFDPGKCQKEIFAPLSAVLLARHLSGGPDPSPKSYLLSYGRLDLHDLLVRRLSKV